MQREKRINYSSLEELEHYKNERWDFRYNTVTSKVEFRNKGEERFREVDDYVFNSIVRELKLQGFKCTTNSIRTLLASDFTPKFDPFVEYINDLKSWDGKIDYINKLASTVKTDNQKLWLMCCKKWFVAFVACFYVPKIINQTVIVLAGPQGIGKTTWLLRLLPPELGEYAFLGTINPDNKDALINLSECALIVLDELENLNRSQLGSLKEMITKPHVRLRKPYGYTQDSLPRRASFVGSVNGDQFLSDTTGNRRFLCFMTHEINYRHRVPMDKVIAQALFLFQNGFQYWFDKTEISLINKNNERYRIRKVEEELLLNFFEPCKKVEASHILSTTKLSILLAERSQIKQKIYVSHLGRVLRMYGFLRLKEKGVYCYALKEITEARPHFTASAKRRKVIG